MGVRLLDLARTMYPHDFRFLPPFREGGKPFLSLLAGHRDFENVEWDADAILTRYRRESQAFLLRRFFREEMTANHPHIRCVAPLHDAATDAAMMAKTML